MSRKQFLVGGVTAAAAVITLATCTSSKEIMMTKPADALFASYVSLGNSITAGFQSGGINDSTQDSSYAVMFAHQAATRFAVPLLSKPGCPPPIDNFVTQTRVGGGSATTCYLRDISSITSVINNVAVPGAASIDPSSLTTANSNALTTFILGGLSQDQRAVQANPTFASAWIGNNDVLAAALSGILVPAAPYSPGVTSQATFVKNYAAMITGLQSAPNLKGGALFAVIDVTNAALLFKAHFLVDSLNLNLEFAAASGLPPGTPITVDASCANPVPLISFQMTSYIANGTLPPIVICKKGALPAPVGDLFVLDSAEVPQVQADVAAYNTYIHAKADSLGWAYVDMNPTLSALRQADLIPHFPILSSPTAAFGAFVTLDGIHPSALAHKAIADSMISAVNAKYGTTLTSIP